MNLLFWYRSLMRSVGAALVKLIATATSGIVSFTTNVIRPVKVTCEFSPVQEGTGDSSPDNVRPISGWTNMTLKRNTGPNIWNEEWENGDYSSSNGNKTDNNNKVRSKNLIPVKPQTEYYAYAPVKLNAYYYDANKSFISANTSPGIQHKFTTPQNCYYMTFSTFGRDYNVYQNDISINYPQTETAYHSYLQPVLSITFTDPSTGDPLTVYGGTVTLNEDGSADVVSTMGDIASYAGETLSGAWISSMDVYAEGATPTTGAQVVYELAAPVTHHYDNIGQLQSFPGTNNIWHNMNGGITVEYWIKQ